MAVQSSTGLEASVQAAAPAATPVPLNSRGNTFVFIGDIVTFIAGLSFIPATTVLVGLASRLTDDKALIGAVAMSWSVSWFLPQLIAARLLHGKRRQKPYLIIPSIIGRQTVLLFALWLALSGAQPALLTVWLLIAAVVVFNVCDAIAGISWFDMMSRTLTPRWRGRTIATGQFIGSVLGIGSGLVVERLLAPGGLPFPLNYAVIFGCAWLGFTASLIIILFLRENPLSEEALAQSHEASFLGHTGEVIRSDKMFRRVLLARFLTGMENMTAAFYVVFIKECLQLPDSSIGVFSVAFIVGGILGVMLFGTLADRFGPRRVIHAATALQFMAPVLALAVAVPSGFADASPGVAFGIFVVILAINGAVGRSMMLGFTGYSLDMAPERNRTIYVGVLNTLGGVVALTPVLGGAFIDALSTRSDGSSVGVTPYALMFGVVAVCVCAGALVSLTLPKEAQTPGVVRTERSPETPGV
ncbi:MAG: MFS transporter [Chloroflexi bacterium]|nr:MFS transporter [Chloroflexota bacterium]